jgi:hypothetical protein
MAHDEIWQRFYFAAITGVVAHEGLTKPERVPGVVQQCAAFADEAAKELQRGKDEPQYRMLILGGA